MSSTTETASIFFALLSLLCVIATVGVVALALVRRARPDSATAAFVDDLGRMALWLAWLVATVTTLGSLYYSQIADFIPCELCWFQRICMYPLVLILGVAVWRRDRGVWVYVLPQAVIGAAIAIYHTQLQAFPGQATFCTTADAVHHALRVGVRFRLAPVHGPVGVRVHHRHAVGGPGHRSGPLARRARRRGRRPARFGASRHRSSSP